MMTYKKPVGATDSFLRPSRRYHDFELESGINKKVNCLIAFAAVALIVAVAALSLAIMQLIQVPAHSHFLTRLQYILPSSQQAFHTAEMEVNKLSVLQERVRQLEEQVGLNPFSPLDHHGADYRKSINYHPRIRLVYSRNSRDSGYFCVYPRKKYIIRFLFTNLRLYLLIAFTDSQNGSSVKIIFSNNVNPSILIDESPESPDTLEHPQGGVQLLNTSDAPQQEEETESPKQESREPTLRPPLKSTTPEESRERTEGSADGMEPETPVKCPLYPRPICPVGYVLRDTDDPCPRPVCHPGDDEEDSEGSGEECPEYPQPSCPSGYVVMQSEGPCRRFLCRKQVPQDLK
ncbi:uncharacterized protein LOC135212126 [Macrobrachium nipponense]|uniref:uncharacterized protein LOC135212126 n=1 Tax=Macrobrachium nipponense TaxID=159736 RepID=UPI0030C83499